MPRAAAIRRWVGRTVGFAILMLVLAPGAVSAQGFVSPLIGYDFGGDSGCPEITGCEDKNLNLGVAVGGLGNLFGTELEFAYARDFFGDIPDSSSSLLTLMGNVLLAPRFGVVQPYALVGLGLIKTHVEFSPTSVRDFRNNHLGWDIGGGLIVFLSPHVGIRGDIRHFHAFEELEVLEVLGLGIGGTTLDFGRAAGSVVFKF